MDEKESLPEKPSEGSGDSAAATKVDVDESEEKVTASGTAGAKVSAESTDASSDITKSSTAPVEDENELQNHVDNDVITEDSSSVKSDVASKKDVTDTTDADSQEDAKDEGMFIFNLC